MWFEERVQSEKNSFQNSAYKIEKCLKRYEVNKMPIYCLTRQ